MMRTILARAAVAALSLGFAGLAQAVPMYFDFTGTILGTDTGTDAAVSGGFNFDTDRLAQLDPSGNQYSFIDWQPTDVTDPLAFLNFGGQSVIYPKYASNYSLITFVEGCSGDCGTAFGDFFSVGAFTHDDYPADGIGTVRNDTFVISAFGRIPLPDGSNSVVIDYFDGATAVPTDILNLPLYSLFGFYNQSVSTCEGGNCTYSSNEIQFSLDTVSRGFGPRPVSVSVPEPGTLGLFAFALAGLFFFRRRLISVSTR